MTYLELKNLIDKMTDEQKSQEVTVYVSQVDSHFPVDEIYFADEDYVKYFGYIKQNQPICAIDY